VFRIRAARRQQIVISCAVRISLRQVLLDVSGQIDARCTVPVSSSSVTKIVPRAGRGADWCVTTLAGAGQAPAGRKGLQFAGGSHAETRQRLGAAVRADAGPSVTPSQGIGGDDLPPSAGSGSAIGELRRTRIVQQFGSGRIAATSQCALARWPGELGERVGAGQRLQRPRSSCAQRARSSTSSNG
jgi:hypothetical protein